MTSLTLYGSNVAGTTLTTTDKLATTTGGTQASTTTTAPTGPVQGYMELLSQGGSGTVNASLPAPSGKGFLLDSTTLEGQTLSGSSVTASVAVADTAGSGSVQSIVLRLYKRSSAGVYTAIGTLTLSTPTLNTTRTAYTLTGSAITTTAFATGDKLYTDVFIQTGGASSWTADPIVNYVSNSATAGVANNLQISGLSYTTGTPVSKSLPLRTRVRTAAAKSLALRALVRTSALKSLPIRTLISSRSTRSIPMRVIASASSLKSLALRAIVMTQGNKSIPVRIVVREPGNTYSINIAGDDVFVQATTLSIDNTIGKRSTASFTVVSDTSTHFYQYQQVWIFDKSGVLAFSGYITQPQERRVGFGSTAKLVHTISCTDQHYLADKRVVAAVYSNKTCGYIVQDIIATVLYQEGVSIGQIYDGITPSHTLYPSATLYPNGNVGLIPSATFVYCSVAQAMDALVTAASSAGIPYYWQIDSNKRIWFVPYSAIIDADVVDGSAIEDKVSPPTLSRQNPTYRNTQYVTGGTAETLSQTETRIGDGVTQAWAMSYEMSRVPTVQINTGSGYVTKTVGIKGVDSGKDFYWSKGDPIITQDNSGTILRGSPSNDMLKVTYVGQYPSINIAQDSGQIGYQSSIDGTSGIVEAVQQDSNLTSIGNGLSEAGQLLTRYAQQGALFTFTTRDASFSAGQLRTFNLPDFDLNSVQMLVSDVSASDGVDGINIYYTVKAILGPYDTTWQDFFSALLKQQTPANAINVGVSQSLTVLASVSGNLAPSPTFNLTVLASLLPGPTVYPSSTRYPA